VTPCVAVIGWLVDHGVSVFLCAIEDDPALGQIGFAIAVGILLSSLLTARVLIPALTVLIGRRAWWPSRLVHRRTRRPSAAPAPELAK